MQRDPVEEVLRSLDRRVGRIEQILPTLATKDELARYATKEDMLAEGERTRAHFDVVAERLESQIRVIAEGLMSLDQRFEDFRTETRTNFATVDRRLLRLEAGAARDDAPSQ